MVDRDRVYELNGEESRTLAMAGAFGVVPEHDLGSDREDLDTTPNVYMQVLDGSVRDAVEKIGGELFTIVHTPGNPER